MITLYKGDDTGGQLGKNVKIAFHCDDAVDMDGVIVRFSLLDVITKEWTNVHNGDILELSVTHEQSGRLPLGSLFGKIWGEDPSGRVRTFANRLPIIVTNDLRKVYGSDGLDSQDIHVYSPVGWDAIANKPTLFPSKIELVEGLPEALDGMVKSVNGKTADAAGAVTLTLDSFANKDGEIQVKQTLMVSRDGGQTFNAVATLVDVWNEIDNHNSSAAAHANLMAAIASTYARKSNTYTKTEVDDKINQFAAHYLTADADGSAFATVSSLTGATAYYYAGEVVSPTKNDYAIVLDDEGKTARWAFFGEGETGVWQRQYYISSVSFTDDQWAAINSGIKDYLVPKVLTIDESTATKKIVLDDKTFTSFAELTTLVQNGVTRLKYYVTGAAGRPVLYTAHLCDASTIRFDATGTLGETVYTRSIAITKSGDDGIAVSIGALTQVAKKSDIPSVVAPSASATTGQAADALAVATALNGKATAEYSIVRIGNRKGEAVDAFDEVPYDANEKEWKVDLNGSVLFKVSHLEGKKYRVITIHNQVTLTHDFTIEDKEGYFLLPGSSNSVVYEVRNAALCAKSLSSQAVAELNIPTVTTTISTTETGKAAEAAAVATNITNATKLTPVLDADRHVTGYKLGDKASPVLLTDDAKAALFAGAVITSASTELTNMACSVVPFADGMTITFAASTGLRQCEVLITGCTAGAALNVTATKLRGDSDALTLEAGDNHLTFAEYATGEFFVTRHLANEIA